MCRYLLILLTLITVSPGKLWSQPGVTSEAVARVITPLSAMETQALSFGRFSIEGNGGEVAVSADGTRRANGSIVLAPGNFSQGIFAIEGTPETNITIQLPQQPVRLINQMNGSIIEANNWVSFPPANSRIKTDQQGGLVISIGATLLVGPANVNPTGVYTGMFEVVFAYN